MDRERLDPDLVDWDDPWEIDESNRPHLFAHTHYGVDDLDDIRDCESMLFPADTEVGDADWILVGRPPGESPLAVPLAPAQDARRVRPIGIYEASGAILHAYEQEQDTG